MFTQHCRQGYITCPSPDFFKPLDPSYPHPSVNNYLPPTAILVHIAVPVYLLHCTASYLASVDLDLLSKATSNKLTAELPVKSRCL